MPPEQILVVPRSVFGGFLDFRGFRLAGDEPVESWLDQSVYRDREPMEQDPSFKQLIPYILLRHRDQVFRYWRTKKAGENRLHHLYSVGIGGHINPRDANLFTGNAHLLEEAAMRELREEVAVECPVELRRIGWINDDESEVGRVHLGVAYEAWLDSPRVALNEQALGRGEWKPVHELLDGEAYESWSVYAIEQYVASHPSL